MDSEKLIPKQQAGSTTDTIASIDLLDITEAEAKFKAAKEKFLNISAWETFAGAGTAKFTLCDSDGTAISRKPEVGNYIKIYVPAPNNTVGNGFDWVRIETIEELVDGENESVYIRVRPASNPLQNSDEVAHFFDDKATSNFLLKREGKTIYAEVHGRNEVPNTKDVSFLDKLRNGMVAIGGILAASSFQWKSFTEGLINTIKND